MLEDCWVIKYLHYESVKYCCRPQLQTLLVLRLPRVFSSIYFPHQRGPVVKKPVCRFIIFFWGILLNRSTCFNVTFFSLMLNMPAGSFVTFSLKFLILAPVSLRFPCRKAYSALIGQLCQIHTYTLQASMFSLLIHFNLCDNVFCFVFQGSLQWKVVNSLTF